MSAFIVTNATMQNVVNAVHMAFHGGAYTFCGVHVWDRRNLEEIGAVLFTMNQEAVNQRYDIEEPATYKHANHKIVGGIALAPYIKSVDCLLYQCAEGSVPEHDHYKQLEAVREKLVDAMLRNLPEYANAAWDADD